MSALQQAISPSSFTPQDKLETPATGISMNARGVMVDGPRGAFDDYGKLNLPIVITLTNILVSLYQLLK